MMGTACQLYLQSYARVSKITVAAAAWPVYTQNYKHYMYKAANNIIASQCQIMKTQHKDKECNYI